jgi:hypothetical protein
MKMVADERADRVGDVRVAANGKVEVFDGTNWIEYQKVRAGGEVVFRGGSTGTGRGREEADNE